MVNNHNIMVKKEIHSILELLIQNRETQFTIREISLQRKINYKSAYEAIQKLEEEGSITVLKKGQSRLCQFSQKLTPNVYQAEQNRLQNILKNKDLKIMYAQMQKVSTQCIVLLFGSHVKGTQTKHSDYDFLLIGTETQKVEKVLSWIPKEIHITSISYEDFVQMLQSKEFTVVSEALKNNIIFLGIEDYYRFVENA